VNLVVAPEALEELHDAAAFYALKATVELGRAFVEKFERTVNFVLANPRMGAVFDRERRRYLFRRFPYSVIYEVRDDELRVLAVAHHRQRPRYWADRA
jgi:toxin ParE1/3/4